MSVGESVTFNGIVLSDLYTVAGVHRPMTGRTNSTQEISGYDGVRVTGSYIPSGTVTIYILIKDMSVTERREEMRRLTRLLHTDEPKKLSFGTDNGLYYRAILDGMVDPNEHVRASFIQIDFLVEQCILYGETKSVTVPSGGSVQFDVDGSYKAFLKISGTVNGAGDKLLWGLRLDEGDFVRVSTGSSSGRAVTIDCEDRTATVAGETAMITLDSDWLELSGGKHLLRNDIGSGACTVTWQERWL